MLSCLMFKSLIYFELILVCGVGLWLYTFFFKCVFLNIKKYASLGYQIIIIISTCRGGVALKNSLFSQLLICPLLFFFLLSSHKSEFFGIDPVA